MSTEDDWRLDMCCILNALGGCLAECPEACLCKRMPKTVYKEYLRDLFHKTLLEGRTNEYS